MTPALTTPATAGDGRKSGVRRQASPEQRMDASLASSSEGLRWIELSPRILDDKRARALFRRCVRQLMDCPLNAETLLALQSLRSANAEFALSLDSEIQAEFAFTVSVLCDLRAQGWSFRLERRGAFAAPPLPETESAEQRKAQVRAAHLLERDAQLAQPSVKAFIAEMERRRLTEKGWHSIFSVMRDGEELAAQLRDVQDLDIPQRNAKLRRITDPYVQLVNSKAVCEFTGLKLMDMWRYFRHTWNTTYNSTPGRQLAVIIRDRAAANHPVVGIGALGSSIVQLSGRDRWVGWTGSEFIARLREDPTRDWAKWLLRSLQDLIDAVYIKDFVAKKELARREIARPTDGVVGRLRAISVEARRVHRLYPDRAGHKRDLGTDKVDWSARARTHLFRSKRSLALSELLQARMQLQRVGLHSPSAEGLRRALEDRHAVAAIQAVLRRVKAAHVGVDMMDITVCGAVAPYNELLGGKLVALMMTSPDVVSGYNRRYRTAPSVIASSIAGRAMVRRPALVLLGTTSLYDVASSQYNRIKMPASVAGGTSAEAIEYVNLGRTVGFGSFHFSQETVRAMEVFLSRARRGRPVNSIFGEGVNPKLRKVRSALDAASLPSDFLLRHGSARIVYGVPLASNFREVLLGKATRPQYLLSGDSDAAGMIPSYWVSRWVSKRICRPETLDRIAAHRLSHPIAHGARVPLAESPSLGPLFDSVP